jgi:hypothetical protein
MNRDEMISESKSRLEKGENIDDLIKDLKSRGYSKIDTIAVIASACNIGSGRAKEIVHFSPVWAGQRPTDEQFHQDAENAMDQKKPKR